MLLQIGPTIQNKILKQKKKLLLRYYNSHICMCMQKIEATSISEKEEEEEEKQIQCVAFAKLLYILYFYRYELFG